MYRPLVLVCVVLAGCATYQPRPIAPAQLSQRFEERSLNSETLHAWLERQPGHDAGRWPLPRWNREMLTLAAYYYSPALDIARAQWGTAKAGIKAAGAMPNPSLQLPFEYTTNHQGAGRPCTTGPALDMPIETAHKRGYRIDQAAQLSEAARLNIGNEAWKVRGQVRDALLSLYAERERVALLTLKAATQQQIVDMVEKRRAVGEAAVPDVNQAFFALTEAQADLTSARNGLRNARSRLASAIGLPVAAFDSVQFDLGEFEHPRPPPPPAVARRAAIFHRADLLGSLAEYAATEAALQTEIARQYPDIHIGPSYTYDVGANKIGFGLAGITLPIFDRNQGGIAQAEAKRTEAAARTAALQDTILNDLDRAFAHYQASVDTLHLSTLRLSTAQKQMDSQSARFAVGAIDRLALAQARANTQTSAMAHLDDVVAAQQAANALEDAMQMPLSPETPDRTLTEKAISR